MSMKNVFIRVSVFNIVYFITGAVIIHTFGLNLYLLIPLAIIVLIWARYSYKMNIEALKKESVMKMEDKEGVVIEDLDPYGTVKIGNEYWNAYSEKFIQKGRKIKVIDHDGLTLIVGAENDKRKKSNS